jgi:hypothetical protein
MVELQGVTYEWKDTTAQGHETGTQIGFIAQDVAKVRPKWVGEDKQGFKVRPARTPFSTSRTA